MSTFLTSEELAELTRRKHRDAQMRVLHFMGIEHKLRPDGSVVVSRAHIESALGGPVASAVPKEYALDLAAIR